MYEKKIIEKVIKNLLQDLKMSLLNLALLWFM